VRLIFVGDGDKTALCKFIDENNLRDRVSFTGWLTGQPYEDILASASCGVILRRPPTNWETSAGLFDLLSFGIPTVISDIDTFREIPNHIVKKCSSPSLVEEVLYCMKYILYNVEYRQQLGRKAREYVRVHHSLERSADMYKTILREEEL
jgi:glycosyltransferase involved in cell wall biosynthesis